MNQDKSRLQTILLTQLLGETPKKQDFDVMVINDYQTSTAIMRLHFTMKKEGTVFMPITKSLLTGYSDEKTTFGKGIRLLLLLDKQHGFLSWLKREDIGAIIVTTVKDPSQMTRDNHFSYSTGDLEPLIKELRSIESAHKQAYELAVSSLIAQNTSR
ncbi:hypothetical protein OQX61_07485 [Pedobacter sp. PLR]|uniref:hypothetical protein n=1 Tax=Pedobacter sp. PLR TaxID=2994465 RepID=UPI0022484423|nr:hypothetical protein [Pedobacter sp. PLR]MCX2451111.1 hypothetical protein [Pedobacter sp. PLR]